MQSLDLTLRDFVIPHDVTIRILDKGLRERKPGIWEYCIQIEAGKIKLGNYEVAVEYVRTYSADDPDMLNHYMVHLAGALYEAANAGTIIEHHPTEASFKVPDTEATIAGSFLDLQEFNDENW